MLPSSAPDLQADGDRLDVATDQAIAACGGNARDTVKALLVANEYLEAEMQQLRAAVSSGYARAKGLDASKPTPAELEQAHG
jgi:hypothetical protein